MRSRSQSTECHRLSAALGALIQPSVERCMMPKKAEVYIFAYGSNLHVRRMQSRVPSARTVSIGYVPGRTVLFHKRSIDGSAKADAIHTDNPDHRVWGVVYRIEPAEKPILDEYEHLGIGYDQEQVYVVSHGMVSTVAWIYFARREAIDASGRPYSWYMNFVLSGALQHRLPLCYISRLGDVPSWRDPGLQRHQENHRIVSEQST